MQYTQQGQQTRPRTIQCYGPEPEVFVNQAQAQDNIQNPVSSGSDLDINNGF